MRYIDAFLNQITMYRVVLYELIAILLVAGILGFFGALGFSPIMIGFSVAYILAFSLLVNSVFAYVFEAPSNPESTYITALILALVITPPSTLLDGQFLSLAGSAAALAMASKYIFAIRNKHIFNPVAVAIAITAFTLNQSASWWVGTTAMLPIVVIGGFLVIRKIQRADLFWSFIVAAVASTVAPSIMHGTLSLSGLQIMFLQSPLIFFATVMLTEPLTTPPHRTLQIMYGAFAGFLFAPWVHVGSVYFTPEITLIAGNIFSYLVSPKQKLLLQLKEKIQLSPDVYEFVFATKNRPMFKPGQYMEWTHAHPWSDTRGIRRYFTLASSPTERDVRLGVKFYNDGSSFKKHLLSMLPGETMVASQLAGDFVLPRNKKTKLAFIAGGIGITPFRAMIKYLVDNNESRPVTLLFANKTPADVVYQEFFNEAKSRIGLKTVYAFSESKFAPIGVPGVVAAFDRETIAREVPDYKERMFYLSGPRGMVTAFDDTLRSMGVRAHMIKKDFFPGFA